MNIYTVTFEGVEDGALVEIFGKYPVITVGEDGRGRKFDYVPVKGASEGEKIYKARLKIKDGISFLEKMQPDEHDDTCDVIVVAKPIHGFRGSGGVKGRFLSSFDSYKLPECEEYNPQILAEGVTADGAAGRMGSSNQVIFVARDGDQFCLWRTGRLYGHKPIAEFRVSCGRVIFNEYPYLEKIFEEDE